MTDISATAIAARESSRVSGRFGEQRGINPPEGSLTSAVRDFDLDPASEELLNAFQNEYPLSLTTSAEAAHGTDELRITLDDGAEYRIMKRSDVSEVIYDEILNEDRAWLVPRAFAAQATKVDKNVFFLLCDQGERSNDSVKSIFVATNSADDAADLLAADEDRVGEWFSSYDGLTVDLGEGVLAFRTQ